MIYACQGAQRIQEVLSGCFRILSAQFICHRGLYMLWLDITHILTVGRIAG